MPPPPSVPMTALNAAGLNIFDLRQIIKLDIAASNELQKLIDNVKQDIRDGHLPPGKRIDTMEAANKDMTKDLMERIERIERQGQLTPTDREILQTLNTRLAVCDRQAMHLAEIRDLEAQLEEKYQRESEYTDPLPLGGAPRKPSRVNTVQLPAETPGGIANLPPPPSYTPPFTPQFTPRQQSACTSPFLPRQSSDPPRSRVTRLSHAESSGHSSPAVFHFDTRRSNSSIEPLEKPHIPPSPPIGTGAAYGDPRRSNPNLNVPIASPSPPAEAFYRNTSQRTSFEASYIPPSPPMVGLGVKSSPSQSSSIPSYPTPPYGSASSSEDRRSNPSLEKVDSRFVQPSPPPNLRSRSRGDRTGSRPGSSYVPPSPPVGSGASFAPPVSVSRRSSGKAGKGEYHYYAYADYSDSDDELVAEWEKTDWPLAYRILDINPATDSKTVQQEAQDALARLSLKHDPQRFPNDPDAPTRWAAINKAFDVLVHPIRKQYYDCHGCEPEELKEVDIEELKIIDECRDPYGGSMR